MFDFSRYWWNGAGFGGAEVKRRARKGKHRPGRRRVKPRLEALEDRTLPNASFGLSGYPIWEEQGPGPIVNGGGQLSSGAVQSIAVANTAQGAEVYDTPQTVTYPPPPTQY